MKRNLDAAISVRTELEGRMKQAEEKIRRIGLGFENVSKAREGQRQQIASLHEDLERVKSNLEKETVRRQESEDQLRDALSQQQQLEQDLERFVSGDQEPPCRYHCRAQDA